MAPPGRAAEGSRALRTTTFFVLSDVVVAGVAGAVWLAATEPPWISSFWRGPKVWLDRSVRVTRRALPPECIPPTVPGRIACR